MNTFTRLTAWVHVVLSGLLLFVLSAILGGGTAVTDALAESVARAWPQGTSCILPLAKLSGTAIAAALGCALAALLLWFFLLRKQVWAWWVLVVLIALGIADMVIGRFPTDNVRLDEFIAESPRVTLGYGHLLAGLVLALDPPWNWRGRRRSGAPKRRKSRASRSASSSRRSRSRRSGRR